MKSIVNIVALASAAQAILVAPPTGPFAVSMSVTPLTDESRLDPYAPANATHARRILISTFLPVNETQTPCRNNKIVPYMTPLLDFCVARTSPCRAPSATHPLVIFSPGWGNPRLLYGAMARELASHGFAVVTVDHPYDATYVEFPDGEVRAQDASFLLTHLLDTPTPGINTSAPLIMGHSLGGATAASAMLTDPRFVAGMNIDGLLPEPVLSAGEEDTTWDTFYAALRGPKAQLAVNGTVHASFTDFPTLIKTLDLELPEDAAALLQSQIGTLAFGRASEVVAGIVGDFADLVLRRGDGGVFGNGDAALPEVTVERAAI
ncbi:1-alkyl-2-acetylglycerophosphocholine esterase like protein [Verticillium longisporum]|nr:1-alkyl-2-acetylglycerophosphocholine esterase like protein [Verticillium longisporum]